MENEIVGNWKTREVKIDGQPLDPTPSHHIWNHSPDGFMWGYQGSGPAQLALAVLYEVTGDEKQAVALHQTFKREVIGILPQDDFVILIDVKAWVNNAIDKTLQKIMGALSHMEESHD